MPWVTVRAWAGSARPGRCAYCKAPIVWVVTDKGKYLPFNLGFTVREIVVDPRSRAQFTVLDRADRHDCDERRAWRKTQRGQTDNKRSQIGEL